MSDACPNGRRLKCLTMTDEYICECLAIDVAGGNRSARVTEVLAARPVRAATRLSWWNESG